MTRVEECTKAEIGVGAAIAKGNQGEKGYKALFVIKVTKMKNIKKLLKISDEKVNMFGFEYKKITIEIRKNESPIRFINKVNKPDVIED